MPLSNNYFEHIRVENPMFLKMADKLNQEHERLEGYPMMDSKEQRKICRRDTFV